MLGPIWLTFGTIAWIFGMALVLSALFNQPLVSFLPHTTIGMFVWAFFALSLTGRLQRLHQRLGPHPFDAAAAAVPCRPGAAALRVPLRALPAGLHPADDRHRQPARGRWRCWRSPASRSRSSLRSG
ncbi:MAG: hypothetical protein WDN72_03640 [Alphaproteobacteria bacterium]